MTTRYHVARMAHGPVKACHAVPSDDARLRVAAVCGRRPAPSYRPLARRWTSLGATAVTCPKCIAQMKRLGIVLPVAETTTNEATTTTTESDPCP